MTKSTNFLTRREKKPFIWSGYKSQYRSPQNINSRTPYYRTTSSTVKVLFKEMLIVSMLDLSYVVTLKSFLVSWIRYV
jgi:hypothetical protein